MADLTIFDYVDYRAYLRDSYLAHKKLKKEYSFQYFSKKIGFASRAFLKMVMDGKRNLSLQAVEKVNRAFKHGKGESEYLRAMVLYAHAKSDDERRIYLDKMSSLKPRFRMAAIEREKYEVLTDKIYLILREAVEHPDFKEDPHWLCEKLRFTATPERIRDVLNTLLRLGLLARGEDGRLRQVDAVISTPRKVEIVDAFRYHDQILNLTRQALMTDPASFCDVTSMTIPIPAELLPKIHQLADEFRAKIAQLVNAGSREYHEVYLVNVQAFPVTRFRKDDVIPD